MNHSLSSLILERVAPPLVALLLVGCVAVVPATARFTPVAARLTDGVIARDLARFDSLERAVAGRADERSGHAMSGARGVAFVRLARESYERNDDGQLTAALLDAAEGLTGGVFARTRRVELWNVLDSLRGHSEPSLADDSLALALEVALMRAQYEVLGAPSCAAWEREAEQIAARVRQVAPPPPPAPAPPPAHPAVPLATAPLAELRAVPSLVHFALDRSDLAPASRRVLGALVDSLRHFPEVRVVLEGHTDRRASAAYNNQLSRRRALSVQAHLVELGIDPARIRMEAFGKTRLETNDRGVRDHARNRRVLIRYFTSDGREIPAVSQLDDLQVERL